MPFFFKPFPTTRYNNAAVTNLTVRIKFIESALRNNAVFYPYTVADNERPEDIANHYYDDPSYSWIVLLANNITDPYHGWHMSSDRMRDFIIKKYGSIEAAEEQIMFYRVNWPGDESVLDVAAYEALPAERKKYWKPILNTYLEVAGYDRKPVDWVVDTNKVITFGYDVVSGSLEMGEIITQANTGAQGTISNIASGEVILKHISGAFNDADNVTGSSSGAIATPSSTVETLATPISTTVAVYWSPVTAMDVEEEQNNQRREIILLEKSNLAKIEESLSTLFKT